MKIALVVDDSKTMRDLNSATLESMGFEVMSAVDGKHALEVLGDKDVKVITTDYNMPNMNGVDLVKALRASSKYKFTPILLISSESDEKIKMQAKESGATGWIKKPFEKNTLIAAVSKICGLE